MAIAFARPIALERCPIFKIVSFLEYLVFFQAVFSENNSNVLVEWFWHFLILTRTDHFAKTIAFAWAIAFARWLIFKIVSFLVIWCFFFSGFFAKNNRNVLVKWVFACFWHF